MAEIDCKQILDGITLSLHTIYPNVNIHSGIILQGLNNGDFNVIPLNPYFSVLLGGRNRIDISFDVMMYQIPSDGNMADCLTAIQTISSRLSDITTPNGDTVHANKCDCRIDDGVLHCIVRYTVFTRTPSVADFMATLTLN